MKLTVKKLVVNRGDRRVIDDLSFSLKAGETLILTGSNGSGKTTLIRALAGFITPVDGTIELTGPDLDPEIPLPERCHYVGHLNGTKSALTVTENLEFWSRYLNVSGGNEPNHNEPIHNEPIHNEPIHNETAANSPRSSTLDALAHFNLSDLGDIPARYLSAGQKRRLGLARLLVAKRPIWLLDEPTVSLDAESVAQLAQAVDTHVKDGGIVIAATHIPLGIKGARELHLKQPQVHA